jgi:hypothetical protein
MTYLAKLWDGNWVRTSATSPLLYRSLLYRQSHALPQGWQKPSPRNMKMSLHVHPLLGNELVKKFLQRQILGRQSLVKSRTNVYSSFLGNNQRANGLARQLSHNLFSMWSAPCAMLSNRTVKTSKIIGVFYGIRAEGRFQSVIAEKLWVKDTKPSRKRVLEVSAFESAWTRTERVHRELWRLRII